MATRVTKRTGRELPTSKASIDWFARYAPVLCYVLEHKCDIPRDLSEDIDGQEVNLYHWLHLQWKELNHYKLYYFDRYEALCQLAETGYVWPDDQDNAGANPKHRQRTRRITVDEEIENDADLTAGERINSPVVLRSRTAKNNALFSNSSYQNAKDIFFGNQQGASNVTEAATKNKEHQQQQLQLQQQQSRTRTQETSTKQSAPKEAEHMAQPKAPVRRSRAIARKSEKSSSQPHPPQSRRQHQDKAQAEEKKRDTALELATAMVVDSDSELASEPEVGIVAAADSDITSESDTQQASSSNIERSSAEKTYKFAVFAFRRKSSSPRRKTSIQLGIGRVISVQDGNLFINMLRPEDATEKADRCDVKYSIDFDDIARIPLIDVFSTDISFDSEFGGYLREDSKEIIRGLLKKHHPIQLSA